MTIDRDRCAVCGDQLDGTHPLFCRPCRTDTPISAECATGGDHPDCAGDVWLDDQRHACSCGCHAIAATAEETP